MLNNRDILIQKLDEFIRKYYKNLLVKGALYGLTVMLSVFLSVVLLEYFGQFNSVFRGILFFTFIGVSALVLWRFILFPLLRLYKIGKGISYEQAAQVIGQHFTNVQDKLLNVLQLQSVQQLDPGNTLLLAGIDQKIEQLKPVPFSGAVDFSENKKYLPYVLPLLLFTTGLAYFWPQVISRSTDRLVHYTSFYEKEMPFQFLIKNSSLQTLQNSDYTLEVEMQGRQVPDEVYLLINGIEYRMQKENIERFTHLFSNPQNSIRFQFSAAGYLSKEYELKVLPKPTLLHFDLELIYPEYLKRASEKIPNTGDIQIPQGTKVNWVFNTRNTNSILMRLNDSLVFPSPSGSEQFTFSKRFMESARYSIKPTNAVVNGAADSMNYNVLVLPDQYPSISLDAVQDSLEPSRLYYSGMIKDDYGFEGLRFFYTVFSTDTSGQPIKIEKQTELNIARDKVSQTYYHYFDLKPFALLPGDKVEYYFEVSDNDGVNGSKTTRSETMVFKTPSREELSQKTDKNNTEIKKDLEESISKAKQLQKDITELSKKINDKKQLGYEEKKKLEDLMKKQNELQQKIDQLKQENERNNKMQNEFSQTDESLLEKQQQLEKLFDEVMTPEMKKLFDELNKMLEKLDKNQVQEKLEELKLNNKDIEKELDRNLELFKQLEVEQKLQEAIDKLDELQKQEEALNQETEGKKPEENKTGEKEEAADKKENSDKKDGSPEEKNKKPDNKELQKKQDEINKEFEKLKEQLKELEQKNKALEEPNTLPEQQQKQEEVSKELNNSSKELGSNNKKNASKSQKKAAQSMQEMKEELEQSMEENEESQNEENAQALRQILENLLNLSFAQEDLIKTLPKTRIDNPQFVQIPKQQNKLKDDSKIIEDSLLALSKRAPQVSATINREISAIHLNMDKTVKALAERNSGESLMRMQGTMTSVNNLALLLNESLEQMQNQMKQQMQNKGQKSGKCKKPGSGSGKNPSSQGQPVQNMRKMQEQLNKQLQEMKDALEKGQKPGEKPGDKKGQKPGSGLGQNGKTGNGIPGSSEQFAKMAAQQEALRRQMQAMMDKLKNKGSNPGGDLANLMEQTEKDLVNKQLTNETMRRQQEILTRLLESEKAERERDQDEQRKSNEAKNQELSNPENFLEYKRLKEKEMELLNTVPPGLTPYYKDKVNNYFNGLNRR
ncbi:MAG: hypothetical protein JNK73_11215 [Bacteroidia bacterium]|nr:hypothetical protein [Bacteroidia bacterium]